MTADVVFPTPPLMLYVATTFMPFRWRTAFGRGCQQLAQGAACRLAVVVGEPGGELGARCGPALLELLDELAGGEERIDGQAVCQLGDDTAQVRDVDVGILMHPEVVLQGLQARDERLASGRRVQPPEALEEIAEPLGVLAQFVDEGRRVLAVIARPAVSS